MTIKKSVIEVVKTIFPHDLTVDIRSNDEGLEYLGSLMENFLGRDFITELVAFYHNDTSKNYTLKKEELYACLYYIYHSLTIDADDFINLLDDVYVD